MMRSVRCVVVVVCLLVVFAAFSSHAQAQAQAQATIVNPPPKRNLIQTILHNAYCGFYLEAKPECIIDFDLTNDFTSIINNQAKMFIIKDESVRTEVVKEIQTEVIKQDVIVKEGEKGESGEAGSAGDQGPAGPSGADGAQGPAGPAGADGATGPAGAAGPQGIAGQDGVDGQDGQDGVDGIDGSLFDTTIPHTWTALNTFTAGVTVSGGLTSSDLTSTLATLNLQSAGAGQVIVGSGAASAGPDLFVLDLKSTAGDPAGTEGAMYYNDSVNKFRCFENGLWTDCISTAATVLWDTITNPVGSLALTMGSNTSTFTYGAATGAANLFNLTDTAANTGTGYILNVSTGAGSSAKPLNISSAGTQAFSVDASQNVNIHNGVTFNTSGVTVLGDGGDTVAINSSDWDISVTGDFTGAGAITMDGNFTQSGATTFSTGTGAVSLNGNTTITGANTFATGTGLTTINGNLIQSGAGTTTTGTGTFTAGGNATITGDITISGNDLFFGNGEGFSNATDGNLETTLPIAGLLNILGGNIKIGNGVPDLALNGEDGYVEGTFEVDGASRMDGAVTFNGSTTFNALATFNSGLACTDCLDFDSFSDTLTLDSSTSVTLGANDLTMAITGLGLPSYTRGGSGQWFDFTDGVDTFGIYNRSGTPEGNITANTGSLAIDTSSGALYIKTDDGDNTNWSIFGLAGAGLLTASNGLTAVVNDVQLGGTLSSNTSIATSGFNLTIDGVADSVFFDSGNATIGADLLVNGNDISFGNLETISNAVDGVLALTSPSTTFSGDITISGDDLFMATNTLGAILVADGTNFNPVVLSGDAAVSAGGVLTISTDSVDGTNISVGGETTGDLLIFNGTDWDDVAMSSDATITSAGVLTISGDAVALGTDTTGNYVATLTAGNGLSGTVAAEGATPTLALGALTADWNQTGAFDISLNNASSELKILESAGATFYGTLDVGDLTADRTYTLPDASGTLLLSGGSLFTQASDAGSYSVSQSGTSTIAGGTNGIDTSAAGSTTTLNLDTTEIGTTTFGSGAGITWTFDASAGTDTTIAWGNDAVTLTSGTTTVTGNATVGLDLTVTGNDIIFGNSETISNAVDGVLALTSPSTTFSGDITVSGNDLIFGNGEGFSNATDGNLETTLPAAGLLNLFGGNIKVGDGVPNLALNGEDGYVEGTFEVDGASIFDGAATFNSTVTFSGGFSCTDCLDFDSFDFAMQLDEATTIDMNGLSLTLDGVADTIFANSGNLTVGGDITISGDDLFMATNTLGAILVADGTNFNPVVLSGDAAVSAGGVLTISTDSVDGTNISVGGETTGDLLIFNGTDWDDVAMSSDATITSAGVLTISGDAVALGTDTTGNYVATLTAGNGLSGTVAAEGATPTLALGALTADWNQTGAFDISLNNASSELKILESAGATFYGTLDVGDLTADRTYTLPDASGTIMLDSSSIKLNKLTNADNTNTLDAFNLNQTWNWSSLTTETALALSAATQTSGKVLSLTGSGAAMTAGGTILDISAGANTTGAGLSIASTGTYTGTGLFNITANAATSGDIARISGTSVTSGSALHIIGGASMGNNAKLIHIETAGALSGTALGISNTANYAGVGGLLQVIANSSTGGTLAYLSGTSLTTGTGMEFVSGNSLAAGGELLNLNMAASTDGAGLVATTTGTYTGAGLIQITADSATSGSALNISTTGLTTGSAISVTGGAILAATGELLNLNMGAATVGSGENISTTGVYTGAGLLQLTANSATTGTIQSISSTGITSGTSLNILGGSSMVAAGELLNLDMGAATAGGGLKIATTGAYTGAGLLQITANSATTGSIQTLTANAITSGNILDISTSSTTTTTGSLLKISNTGASAATSNLLTLSNTAGASSMGGIYLDYQGTGNMIDVVNTGTASSKLLLNSLGQLGVGTNAFGVGMTLAVVGGAEKTVAGAWAGISDERVKQEIYPFTEGLATILQINPVNYEFNELLPNNTGLLGKSYIGVIAQEIETVAPYTVVQGEGVIGNEKVSDFRKFDPSALTYLTINAIKELNFKIDNSLKFTKEDGLNFALKTDLEGLVSHNQLRIANDEVLQLGQDYALSLISSARYFSQEFSSHDGVQLGQVVGLSNSDTEAEVAQSYENLIGIATLPEPSSNATKLNVSLSGKTVASVTTKNGDIKKGDKLILNTNGQLMKSCGEFKCEDSISLAIALEDFTSDLSEDSVAVKEILDSQITTVESEISKAALLGKDTDSLYRKLSYLKNSMKFDSGEGRILVLITKENIIGVADDNKSLTEKIAEAIQDFALSFTNEISFLASVTFDKIGLFKEGIEVSGPIKASADTAGEAEIVPGLTEVTVYFDKPYDSKPFVQLTAASQIAAKFNLGEVTESYFVIKLSEPATEIAKFNYFAVAGTK